MNDAGFEEAGVTLAEGGVSSEAMTCSFFLFLAVVMDDREGPLLEREEAEAEEELVEVF